MDTGGRKGDEGMDEKARNPVVFASQAEFDDARKNLALYLATLQGWKRGGKACVLLKEESKRDFSQPSLN
jgi:hypothetical protein